MMQLFCVLTGLTLQTRLLSMVILLPTPISLGLELAAYDSTTTYEDSSV